MAISIPDSKSIPGSVVNIFLFSLSKLKYLRSGSLENTLRFVCQGYLVESTLRNNLYGMRAAGLDRRRSQTVRQLR